MKSFKFRIQEMFRLGLKACYSVDSLKVRILYRFRLGLKIGYSVESVMFCIL